METETRLHFTAFVGTRLLASGDLATILAKTKEFVDSKQTDQVLIFDDETGRQRDFNMEGTLRDVLDRAIPEQAPKGPGRPKLGVVSAEVSLLPRHWEWLSRQQQRASGTIRRLVEAAQKDRKGSRAKGLLEAAGNFIWSMAGNFPGFEEASRALYARDWQGTGELTEGWPGDVRSHLLWMMQRVRDADAGPDERLEFLADTRKGPVPDYAHTWELGACDIAHEIAHCRVKASDVMDAFLKRIGSVNGRVNAITTLFEDEAIKEAGLADERLASGVNPGPLAGVPFTVKENIDVAGYPTTHGIPALKGSVPPIDSPLVKRLRDAGAIPIGHTNLPDLSLRFHTRSELYGHTRNPWDPALTPGGSSGGEGAGIASGMSPLGLGNDAGGSVRLPALFNGIAALKPGFGRLPSDRSTGPRDSTLASQVIPVDGILARRVRDLVLAFSVLAGPDVRDPRVPPVGLSGKKPEKLRVAVVKNPGGSAMHADVITAIESAANALASSGYELAETDIPMLNEIVADYGTMVMAELGLAKPMLERLLSKDGLRYIELAMGEAKSAGLSEYLQVTARRQGYQREWAAFFEKYPLVLAPVFSQAIVPADFDIRGIEEYRHIANALSVCTATSFIGVPAVALPTGVMNGRPQGVQVIAGFYREDLCLAAAAAIEEKLGIFTPIDPR